MSRFRLWMVCLSGAAAIWLTGRPENVTGSLSGSQLAAMARAAKGSFVPPTQADLDQARKRLVQAMASLEQRLKTAGPEAHGWRVYLRWEDLRAQLARPEGPELPVLDQIYARFDAGYQGLNLVWFESVRDALRQYLNTARAIGNAELPKQYEELLDELSVHLEAYDRQPSPEQAAAIGAALDWLESAGQAAALVQAIRACYVQPNFFAQASMQLIAATLLREVDEDEPIEDCILGTAVYGTGRAVGEATAELVPNDQRAQVDIVFSGTVRSNTVGYNRSVRVFSDGITWLGTRKSVFIEPDRIWTVPSCADAQTATDIRCIAAPGPLVERIAWRRARRQKPLAEAIGAEHAADRASVRADERGDKEIAQADDRYQKRFRKRLLDRNLYPSQLRYYSTNSALCAVGLQAGRGALAAPTSPPAVAQPHDLTLQLHESLLNNMAEEDLGGAIVPEERFQADVIELLGRLPERLKPDPQSLPWTITFARRLPISLQCGDGEFTVTVRGRSFARGDERYPGMNVTAVYRVESGPEGVKAVRQGDLAIFPPGFQRGAGKRLSVRQQILRDLLERRFSKIFDREIVPEDIELRGGEGQTDRGKLTPVRWEVTPGWMTLSWKHVPPAVDKAKPPQHPASAAR